MSAASSARTHKASRDSVRFTADGERVIRMDPADTHQTFREVEGEPVGAYVRTPTAEKLVGFGEKYDSCGQKRYHFCSECGRVACDDGEPARIGQTCWRKECPRCGKGWAMQGTIESSSKIESLREEVANKRRDDADPPSPRFHHTVVSMPEFSAAGDPDKAFKQVVKGVIDEVGLECYGGVIIHHSHSGEDGDDLGAWKKRVFSGRDWDDVQSELKEWHHAHVIVLADRIEHTLCEALYDQTGIVTHRILQRDNGEFEKEALYENNDENGGKSNVSLYNVYDLASAISYSMSHARDAEDAYTYEYFGAVANHKAPATKKAQMRKATRSVVSRTLNLDVHDVTCEHVDDDDDQVSGIVGAGGSGEGAGGGSGGSDDDGSSSSGGSVCGGRLVPMQFAEDLLDDRDLSYADELRDFLDDWDGPPD